MFLTALASSACGGNEHAPSDSGRFTVPPVEVLVQEARVGSLSESVQLVGNFLPRRRTIIVTEVDGRILTLAKARQKIEVEIDGKRYSEHMSVDLGEPVTKGDTLIQIDPAEYKLALASANARLAETEMMLADLKAWRRPEEVRRLAAMRDEASARLTVAAREVERLGALRKKNVISLSTL